MFSSLSSAELRTPLKLEAELPIAPKPSDFGSLISTKKTVISPLKICNANTIGAIDIRY